MIAHSDTPNSRGSVKRGSKDPLVVTTELGRPNGFMSEGFTECQTRICVKKLRPAAGGYDYHLTIRTELGRPELLKRAGLNRVDLLPRSLLV